MCLAVIGAAAVESGIGPGIDPPESNIIDAGRMTRPDVGIAAAGPSLG